nr:MAG TPA: hypothetical protein [Caudoviricetes sp.]
MKQYLDVNGGKYLTTKMKTYVDDKVKNLPANNINETIFRRKRWEVSHH